MKNIQFFSQQKPQANISQIFIFDPHFILIAIQIDTSDFFIPPRRERMTIKQMQKKKNKKIGINIAAIWWIN